MSLMLGTEVQSMSVQETNKLRETFGLATEDILTIIKHNILAVLDGQLGYSVSHGTAVSVLLNRALPWTLLLVLLACPIFLTIGVLGGIEAGRSAGTQIDLILSKVMSIIASIPPFAGALFLLITFGITWPVLPAGGAEPLRPSGHTMSRIIDIAHHAILPAFSLALHEVARYFFVVRGETITLSSRPFILNARANGVNGWHERRDLYLRNLAALVLSRLSYSIPTLFGAVLFVEVIFSYPGVGRLTYQAALDRDYALLQGTVTVLAALVLLLNWVLDTLTATLSERG